MKTSSPISPVERDLPTPAGNIHYLEWGQQGAPAHLLHANGFCAGTYGPFVKFLVRDLHLVASDIRGHGGSDPLLRHRIRDWEIFAEDLRLLIEKTLPVPVIGLGHSLGAVTTYIAAAKYPHLFRGIVLIDPVILPRRILMFTAVMRLLGLSGHLPLARGARRRRSIFQGKQAALKRFLSGRGIFKSWSPEFVEAYLECGLLEKDEETAVLRCDPELEAQIYESVPLNVWRYARRISCPVMTIRGAFSDTFLPEAAESLRSALADCETVTIPHAGHFIPMEQPEACARAIRGFIQRRLS
jgi:pimeloyl-ACP methyl ester carboxylesterase